VAEKRQTSAHLGHTFFLLLGQPFELSLRARPGGAGGGSEVCDGEKGWAVGASAELGGGERSEVNCRIKGIKELC